MGRWAVDQITTLERICAFKRANDVTLDSSRIFISYHREDTIADAGRLADALERELGPDCVFQDVSGIELGANWERVVDQTLASSVALLLVVGPAWVLTEPIKRELQIALQSGVVIIPILIRGVRFAEFSAKLPDSFRSVEKLNTKTLDHDNWRADIQPLANLLKQMLVDPARARIACSPPKSVDVLEASFNSDSMRSMLVHAADLAECLADSSVLEEAKAIADQSDLDRAHYEMMRLLPGVRYRLLLEEIGRDFLSTDAIYAARYLLDAALEKEIRTAQEEFDEVKSIYIAARGDCMENPKEVQQELFDAEAKAREQLRAKLPGLTIQEDTRKRLDKLVTDTINRTLSADSIRDVWEYTILNKFYRCADLPYVIKDTFKAKNLLSAYESSRKTLPW